MTEIVSHTSLATHSPPFSLSGGIYQVTVSGTIADGIDLPVFQQLVNGSYVNVDPPIRFAKGDVGGTRQTRMLPGSQYRWTVPGSKHLINTSVTKIG